MDGSNIVHIIGTASYHTSHQPFQEWNTSTNLKTLRLVLHWHAKPYSHPVPIINHVVFLSAVKHKPRVIPRPNMGTSKKQSTSKKSPDIE